MVLPAWAGYALAGAGGSVIDYFLSEDDTSQVDAARIMANAQKKYAYPGQKTLAASITPYLFENLGEGLTEKEKNIYRGEGKTQILQTAMGGKEQITSGAAGQGLKGGAVADILRRNFETTIPAMGQLETNIMKADIQRKDQNIQNILGYLSLSAGEGYPVNPAEAFNAQDSAWLAKMQDDATFKAGVMADPEGAASVEKALSDAMAQHVAGGGDEQSFWDAIEKETAKGLDIPLADYQRLQGLQGQLPNTEAVGGMQRNPYTGEMEWPPMTMDDGTVISMETIRSASPIKQALLRTFYAKKYFDKYGVLPSDPMFEGINPYGG